MKMHSIVWEKWKQSAVWAYLWEYRTVPSKAEDEKDDAQEGGHRVPDQGIGMARTEVETEPEGSRQAKQLARQKIHLCRKEKCRWDFKKY